MAAKPKWLLNIPEIRRQLSELVAPVVDRDMVERLFDLRRRRAIELMHCFGGFQSGRTFLINRLQLRPRSRILQDRSGLPNTAGTARQNPSGRYTHDVGAGIIGHRR